MKKQSVGLKLWTSLRFASVLRCSRSVAKSLEVIGDHTEADPAIHTGLAVNHRITILPVPYTPKLPESGERRRAISRMRL